MGQWRTSSYSDANGGQCVEVATADLVMIRDTADRDGRILAVPSQRMGGVHGLAAVSRLSRQARAC
jgi:hypothetical protein